MTTSADPTRDLFAIDARALAALRVALALLVLADVFLRAFDVGALLTDEGVLPRSRLFFYRVGDVDRLSLFFLSGEAGPQALLLGLTALSALLFGLGRHVRITTLTTWVLVTSLQFRNPLVLNGGDIVLRMLLFWAIFLPTGLRFRPGRRNAEAPAPPASVRSVAGAALLMQMALIYLFAAAHKWIEPAWRSLGAVRAAMDVDGAATTFGRFVGDLPLFPEIATGGVLVIESVGPLVVFAVWRHAPLRTGLALGFVAFHLLGLALVFRFGLFPFVMAAGWLPFLPAPFWNALESRARGLVRATRPVHARARPATSLVVGTVFATIVWHNLATVGVVPGDTGGPTGFLRSPHHLLGLGQRWSLWSNPPTNRYFVLAAMTRDGDVIDLRRDGAPLDFARPALRSKNARWWKMELGLSDEVTTPLRAGFVCHAMHRWNASQPPGRRIDNVTLWAIFGSREAVFAGQGLRLRLWQSVLPNAGPATIPTHLRCPAD